MTRTGGPSPAEHHLGDRLAALVDGELGHDARERVLAHLATCPRCKAEADAQRQLKAFFARAASPPPSEGLLARLHNLPATALEGDDDRGGPGGGETRLMGRPGAFGAREEAFAFLPTPPRERGFRIHEMGRPSPRGRRFAFAAAGAVSLAAFALSGTLPLDETAPPRNRADGAGAAVTPPSAHQTAAAASWHLGVHRMDAALRTPVGGSAMPAVGGPVAAQVPPALKPPAPLPAFRASALPVSTMLPPVVQSALSLGSPLLPAAATAKPERTATATPRPTKGGPPLVVTATGPK